MSRIWCLVCCGLVACLSQAVHGQSASNSGDSARSKPAVQATNPVSSLTASAGSTKQANAEALVSKGIELSHQKSFTAALDLFKRALSLEPTNYFAQCWLANTLVRVGRDDEAITAFEKALEISPRDHYANFWRGLLLMKLGRLEQAIPNLEQALASKPNDKTTRWCLLGAYLGTGQLKEVAGLKFGFITPVALASMVVCLAALAWLLRLSFRLNPRPTPGAGFVLAWCLMVLFGQNVLSLVPLFVFSCPLSEAIALGLILSAVPLLVAALWAFPRQPWGSPFTFSPGKIGPRLILLSLAGLVGIQVFEQFYEWLAKLFTGKPLPDQVVVLLFGEGGKNVTWLLLVAVVVMGPLAEEILFRGLLFGALRKRFSAYWTVIITAALFAFVHLQLAFFLPLFAFGLLLGWLRQRSGNLALPCLLHCINNCGALLIVLFSKRGT
jgi:membrane protease YdiL (CAAX protease family)